MNNEVERYISLLQKKQKLTQTVGTIEAMVYFHAQHSNSPDSHERRLHQSCMMVENCAQVIPVSSPASSFSRRCIRCLVIFSLPSPAKTSKRNEAAAVSSSPAADLETKGPPRGG